MPSGGRATLAHVDALTGLRGCAAAWVVLYHAWVLSAPRRMAFDAFGIAIDFTPFFSGGWAGVQMFFVLSGFLLAQPFASAQAGLAPQPATGAYLLRRVRRVFPAYYVQLLVLVAIAWSTSGHWPIDTWGSALRHVTMLFMPLPLAGEALNGIWWSLPVEFLFYLLLPLLAPLLQPQRVLVLMAFCLSAMATWRWGTATWLADEPLSRRFLVGCQTPGVMDSFGIGMLGALIAVHIDRWPRIARATASPLVVVVALSGLVACLYWIHTGFRAYWANSVIFYTWTPAFGLALVVLILSAARGNWLANALFGNRAAVFVGVVSYSVYLWHMPILDAVRAQLAEGRFGGYALLPLLAVAVCVVMPLSWLSWRYVERPFQAARGRAERGGTATAVPPRL